MTDKQTDSNNDQENNNDTGNSADNNNDSSTTVRHGLVATSNNQPSTEGSNVESSINNQQNMNNVNNFDGNHFQQNPNVYPPNFASMNSTNSNNEGLSCFRFSGTKNGSFDNHLGYMI